MENVEGFQADCYALRSNGVPMPGKFIGLDEAGLCRIQSPGGREYSFHADNVLPVEEVEDQLKTWRTDQVANTYQFEEIRVDRSGMVVRCWNPVHPIKSNYLLTFGNARETCNCPAFIKAGGATPCKHLRGYHQRRDRMTAERPTIISAPVGGLDAKPVRRSYSAEEW